MSRSINEILKDMEPLQKQLDELRDEMEKELIKKNEAWYRRFRPEVFTEKESNEDKRINHKDNARDNSGAE